MEYEKVGNGTQVTRPCQCYEVAINFIKSYYKENTDLNRVIVLKQKIDTKILFHSFHPFYSTPKKSKFDLKSAGIQNRTSKTKFGDTDSQWQFKVRCWI